MMMFFTKIICSFEPASKRSPCFVHTSQTGNWSQGKLGRTSAGITRSSQLFCWFVHHMVAKKNHLVELHRRTGVPLFVDSYCSITERKFAGSPEKKQSYNTNSFKNKIVQKQTINWSTFYAFSNFILFYLQWSGRGFCIHSPGSVLSALLAASLTSSMDRSLKAILCSAVMLTKTHFV